MSVADSTPLIVKVDITTFRGSIGGIHYYGKFVVHYDQDHPMNHTDIERPLMDREEVEFLNKKDGNDPDYYWIKVGDMTTRFNTEDEVKERAAEIVTDVFGPNTVLYFDHEYEVDDPKYGKYWDRKPTPLYQPDLAAKVTATGKASLDRLMGQLGYELENVNG